MYCKSFLIVSFVKQIPLVKQCATSVWGHDGGNAAVLDESVDTKIPVQYVLVIMYRGNMPFFKKGDERLI